MAEVGNEAGAEIVCASSLKAVLDRDWDQVEQRAGALELVLQVLQAMEAWVQTLEPEERELAQPAITTAKQVKEPDVQFAEHGKVSLIKRVAKDRRISIEDAEMRHGRKSRSVRVDGYKRHVLHDLDTGLIRAVGITPANAPEASVTEAISADLEQQPVTLKELHIDRAYLSSYFVRERSDELDVYCKAWPVREGKRFSKQMFLLDWDRQIIRCPAKQEMPFVPGAHVIEAFARISSICAGALSSTIYMCWLVPNNSLLSFRKLRDFSTDALEDDSRRGIYRLPVALAEVAAPTAMTALVA